MKLAIAILGVLVVLGSVEAIGDVMNCNLKTGSGCFENGPHFFLTYLGQSPGSYSDCRLSFKLRVELYGSAKGFQCYFVTKNPASRRFTYTISHNSRNFDSTYTPWIRAMGGNARITPARAFSDPYASNSWSYEKFHSPYGQSWVHYRFSKDKLSYYSSNLKHMYSSGHPNMFEPVSKTTYIGLNRKYESSVNSGKGLCQVYCKVTRSFGGRGSYAAFAAPGANGGGEESGAPPPPPAAPSGSAPSLVAANEESNPPPPPPGPRAF